MCRKTLQLALGVLGLLGAAYAAGMAVMAEPVVRSVGLIPDRTAVEFGEVFQQQQLTAGVKLTNETPSKVFIRGVLKGCTCSQARFNRFELDPGESCTLAMEWSMHDRRGPIEETLRILASTAAGEACDTTVKLSATIVPVFTWHPAVVELQSSVGAELVVTVSARDGTGVLREAAADHSGIAVAVGPGKDSIRLIYSPPGGGKGNAGRFRITVATTSSVEPTFQIPIRIME